jgi:hypothetical protein
MDDRELRALVQRLVDARLPVVLDLLANEPEDVDAIAAEPLNSTSVDAECGFRSSPHSFERNADAVPDDAWRI